MSPLRTWTALRYDSLAFPRRGLLLHFNLAGGGLASAEAEVNVLAARQRLRANTTTAGNALVELSGHVGPTQ